MNSRWPFVLLILTIVFLIFFENVINIFYYGDSLTKSSRLLGINAANDSYIPDCFYLNQWEKKILKYLYPEKSSLYSVKKRVGGSSQYENLKIGFLKPQMNGVFDFTDSRVSLKLVSNERSNISENLDLFVKFNEHRLLLDAKNNREYLELFIEKNQTVRDPFLDAYIHISYPYH